MEKAAQDWDHYDGNYHRACKGQTVWTTGLLTGPEADPFKAVCEHFEGVLFKTEHARQDEALQKKIINDMVGSSPPITPEKVLDTLRRTKSGKTPGPDLVPAELLKALVAFPDGAVKLRDFYQEVFQSASRPISVHSHVAKVFSRILLARVGEHLRPTGPSQMASAGRQPADYLWTLSRIHQLALEWGKALAMFKLDIGGAFDNILRLRLAKMLVGRIGKSFPQETRCMLRLLFSGSTQIVTPWGDHAVTSNAGVKQGAVESPVLFGLAIEIALRVVAAHHEEDHCMQTNFSEVAFMDDALVWAQLTSTLQARLDTLVKELAAWGLRLNPKKCQLVCWGQVGARQVKVGDTIIEANPPEVPLTAMCLPFMPGIHRLLIPLDASSTRDVPPTRPTKSSSRPAPPSRADFDSCTKLFGQLWLGLLGCYFLLVPVWKRSTHSCTSASAA